MTVAVPEVTDPPTPPPVARAVISHVSAPADARRDAWRGRLRQSLSSWITSLLVHTALILALALLASRLPPDRHLVLSALPVTVDESPAVLDVANLPDPGAPLVTTTLDAMSSSAAIDIPESLAQHATDLPSATRSRPHEAAFGLQTVATEHLTERTWSFVEGGLEGRQGAMKAQLLGQGGGTAGSEQAVAGALAWLAAHQRPDGSWRFNHHDGPCNGRCRHPGTAATTTGATAIALLPFLGAGHTPTQGEHREVVQRGLYYLTSRMLMTSHGGDLQEGTMYAQGLATIALCEAYAMTDDKALGIAAQHAIEYICYAQHPGGGWRYYPGQPGDTTVFGWQIMALKSGRMARLTVPTTVIENARDYLDSVASDEGAYYGYLKSGQDPAPTAIGLLSRMYYGWDRDDPHLVQGVAYVSELGPSRSDMYFNYYATQLLRQYEGPKWEQWNVELRDYLIRQQSRAGHEAGSWHFDDEHGNVGGRLYTTAMCAMILEVYYRYLPLYSERVVEQGL